MIPEAGADASLRDLLRRSPRPTACKVCGKGPLRRAGESDFNRVAEKPPPFPPCGIAVRYWQCGACGFTWAPVFDDWEDAQFVRHIYNEEYGRVETLANSAQRTANIATMLNRWFGDPPPGTRLLDYGCGPGLLVEAARRVGFDAEGYDRFVPAFRTRPAGEFAIVTCFEVMEHLNRIDEAVDDLLRFRAPDGILVLGTFLASRPFDIHWWYCSPRSGHISMWTFEALGVAFNRRKLDIASDGKVFHFVFAEAERARVAHMLGAR